MQRIEPTQDWFVEDLERHFFHSKFQVQALLSAVDLIDLEAALLRLQGRGVWLDLVVYSIGSEKPVLITNILLRLASGGGNVYTCSVSSLPERFVILDKAQLLTNGAASGDLASFQLNFQRACKTAIPVVAGTGVIRIQASASHDLVKPGETVVLQWEAQGADGLQMEPGNLSLPLSGRLEYLVASDTLFRFSAWNQYGEARQAVLVRCVPREVVRIEVAQLEPEMGEYLVLESPVGFPGCFAVRDNVTLRIRWDAGIGGVLTEKKWGSLPIRGERQITIGKEDTFLRFEYQSLQGIALVRVDLLVERNLPAPKPTLGKWWSGRR